MKQQTIDRAIDLFITHRNYIDKGFQQLQWFKYTFQFYVLASIYIKVVFDNTRIIYTLLPIATVSLIFGCWLCGFIFDRFKMFHAECEFGNRRNNFVEEMRNGYLDLGKKKRR